MHVELEVPVYPSTILLYEYTSVKQTTYTIAYVHAARCEDKTISSYTCSV